MATKPLLSDLLSPETPVSTPVETGKLNEKPVLSSVLAPSAKPVQFRDLSDSDAMRTAIFSNVENAVRTKYPIENTRHRLEIQNMKWAGKPFSLDDQKKAIMRGETLEHRLEGDWVLTDKASGKEVDRRRSTIAHVPWATHRGTFVYRGNEYTVANQMRLRPGVYTRLKDNGIIEAHVNAKGGTGPAFRVYMEPDTGIFRLAVGQSTLKMYPVLKSMGVTDEQIGKAWGPQLLQQNIEADDPRAVSRAFDKLVKEVPGEAEGDTTETPAVP